MRFSDRRLTGILLALCTAGLLPSVGTAEAQLAVSVYGGEAITADSDVKLSLPGAPTTTYHGVSWRSESFVSPFYYGLRLTYWLGRESSFGFAVDFTHAKMHFNDDTVVVSREGQPGQQREPLRDTFNDLSFSHGHNILTLNFVGRLFPAGKRDRSFAGRLQPYGGLGLGVAIPHVEVDLVDGSVTNEYQFGELALEGLVGLSFDAFNRLAVFLEYQLNRVNLRGDLAGGGTLEVTPWTHQLVFGATFGLAPSLP